MHFDADTRKLRAKIQENWFRKEGETNIGDQRESERKTVEEGKSTDRKMLGPQGDFGCFLCSDGSWWSGRSWSLLDLAKRSDSNSKAKTPFFYWGRTRAMLSESSWHQSSTREEREKNVKDKKVNSSLLKSISWPFKLETEHWIVKAGIDQFQLNCMLRVVHTQE